MYNRTQLQMFIVIYIYAVWVNIQSNRFLCISSSQIQSQESCCPPFPLYVLNEHLFLLKHTGFIDDFSMCSLGVIYTFTSFQFPHLFTSLTYWWLRQPSPPSQRKFVLLLVRQNIVASCTCVTHYKPFDLWIIPFPAGVKMPEQKFHWLCLRLWNQMLFLWQLGDYQIYLIIIWKQDKCVYFTTWPHR